LLIRISNASPRVDPSDLRNWLMADVGRGNRRRLPDGALPAKYTNEGMLTRLGANHILTNSFQNSAESLRPD
jgi:hypothetical protein